jgi:beta-alanine--pyruvate transaminase
MNDRANVPTLEQSAFFMPFSMNRHFKKAPRLMARAEGIYYYTPEGKKLIDGASGLWCVNAGHCRERIVKAVQQQVATLTSPRPSRWATRSPSSSPTRSRASRPGT